jgi:hypothetical protein
LIVPLHHLFVGGQGLEPEMQGLLVEAEANQ